MRFKKITVDNAIKGGQKVEVCMEVAVLIGEKIFKLNERDGKLQIRVDGTLLIEPLANNTVVVSEG